MEQYISKDALIAEIEKWVSGWTERLNNTNPSSPSFYEGGIEMGKHIISCLDTLEVKEVENMPNIRFPHYKSIVEKVFGAGNLESFEHEEAEQLVSLAKEELLKDLEVKDVDYERELSKYVAKGIHRFFPNEGDDYCNMDSVVWQDYVIETAKHFFELGLNASNPITEVNLESLVRQVIDLNLEAGEHYNNIIKEERKENGGSDLAINLLCGTIDAKELGIQYVLDKLKA